MLTDAKDGQADVELVSLAKAVGRTVKAIAAISKEAWEAKPMFRFEHGRLQDA